MKLDNFYHFKYSGYCLHRYCYTHKISANVFYGLLKVFHVELGSPSRTSNRTLYLIPPVDCDINSRRNLS